MNSRATPRFWKAFGELSVDVRESAREAYRRFEADPKHPSLRFKKVHATLPIYSARIDRRHRAVGIVQGDAITWFWVGNHDAYDRLLRAM